MDTTLLVYWYEKRIQFIFMTLNAVINEFMFTLCDFKLNSEKMSRVGRVTFHYHINRLTLPLKDFF